MAPALDDPGAGSWPLHSTHGRRRIQASVSACKWTTGDRETRGGEGTASKLAKEFTWSGTGLIVYDSRVFLLRLNCWWQLVPPHLGVDCGPSAYAWLASPSKGLGVHAVISQRGQEWMAAGGCA